MNKNVLFKILVAFLSTKNKIKNKKIMGAVHACQRSMGLVNLQYSTPTPSACQLQISCLAAYNNMMKATRIAKRSLWAVTGHLPPPHTRRQIIIIIIIIIVWSVGHSLFVARKNSKPI